MPIEGPLKELSIHDVFQLLDLARKTGVLRITSELRQNAGMVQFDRGAVVAAEIRSNPHLLGTLLLRAGKLSEEDFARACAMQTAGDARRLGAILLDIGAISRRELERQVRAQVEEVIFELMSWSEGYFSFSDEAVADGGAPVVRIPTEALLMEAARRIDEWARIEARIPHLGVIPQLVPPDAGGTTRLDLLPAEWQLLAAVDGARDVHALAEAVGRSEFDVARTLFGLASAGVVTLEDPRLSRHDAGIGAELTELMTRARSALAAGEPDQARLTALDVVAARPDHPEAQAMLGRALLACGRFSEAAAALEAALRLDPLLASARRMLGAAQAASAQFDDALDTWDAWSRLDGRPPAEDALGGTVSRLRSAVATVLEGIRTAHE
jgi:tetratricopeptide (TPR) repeat protein